MVQTDVNVDTDGETVELETPNGRHEMNSHQARQIALQLIAVCNHIEVDSIELEQ